MSLEKKKKIGSEFYDVTNLKLRDERSQVEKTKYGETYQRQKWKSVSIRQLKRRTSTTTNSGPLTCDRRRNGNKCKEIKMMVSTAQTNWAGPSRKEILMDMRQRN